MTKSLLKGHHIFDMQHVDHVSHDDDTVLCLVRHACDSSNGRLRPVTLCVNGVGYQSDFPSLRHCQIESHWNTKNVAMLFLVSFHY